MEMQHNSVAVYPISPCILMFQRVIFATLKREKIMQIWGNMKPCNCFEAHVARLVHFTLNRGLYAVIKGLELNVICWIIFFHVSQNNFFHFEVSTLVSKLLRQLNSN